MIDHLYIGPAPCDEDCAQIGVTEGASRLKRDFIEAQRTFDQWIKPKGEAA